MHVVIISPCVTFQNYFFLPVGIIKLWSLSRFDIYDTVCACCVLSRVRLFTTLWTVAHQTPLSMGLPRQEYWNGLPFPSPGHLPDPGIEPVSPASPALAGQSFTTEPPGKLLTGAVVCIHCTVHLISRAHLHLLQVVNVTSVGSSHLLGPSNHHNTL